MRYAAGFIGAMCVGFLMAVTHASFWVVCVAEVVYIAVALPLVMLYGRPAQSQDKEPQ